MAQSKAALVVLRFTMDEVPVALFTDERGGESPKSRAIDYARNTPVETLVKRANYWDTDAVNYVSVAVVTFDEFGQPGEIFVVRCFDED